MRRWTDIALENADALTAAPDAAPPWGAGGLSNENQRVIFMPERGGIRRARVSRVARRTQRCLGDAVRTQTPVREGDWVVQERLDPVP